VTGKDTTARRWSVGELARESGVTVRALHHYDEIGLLRASERTGSGHRRYTEDDVRQLYRVRALRALGMPLEEIKDALADPSVDLTAMRGVLRAQLDELAVQADRIDRLTRRIRGLLARLDGASMPDPDQFMTAVELMSTLDRYFTAEQQDRLARRRAELGAETVEAAKVRWTELVEELLPHVRAGTSVDDPRVQRLVRRWDELGSAFHPDDGRTRAAARRMWRDNRAGLSRRLPWPADQLGDLVAYVERARRAG
jgi:DNA-binding transcriptional MerR regulator